MISESREITFDRDITDLAQLEEVLERLIGRLCDALRGAATPGSHDRDQGPARRLLDPHAQPHAARAGQLGRARRPGGARAPAPLRRAAAGAAARRARGRPRDGRRDGRGAAHARALSVGGRPRRAGSTVPPRQYSAEASRRRDSRASGLSTPSSSSTPTTTRRMSSRAPSAPGSASSSRSSAVRGRRRRVPTTLGRDPACRHCSSPDPRREPVGGEAAGHAGPAARAPRRARRGRAGSGPAGTAASARVGSSSSAWRSDASSPRLDQPVGLGGQQRVEEALDHRRRLGADELGGHLAVLERLDRRDALDPEGPRETPGLASTSSLASSILPARAATAFSITGPSWRQGPHHSAQKSTTTGTWCERSMTAVWKSLSVTSIAFIVRRRGSSQGAAVWVSR